MAELKTYDVIVIGGGPGGYVAAIKAAQLGHRVACIDKRATLGGTCLNVGCIPSKALLHSSHKYEEVLHEVGHHGIHVGKVELKLKELLARKDKVVDDLTKGILFLFKKNNVDFIHGTATFQDAYTVVIQQDKTKSHLQAKHFIIATGSEAISLPHIKIDEKRIVSSTGALSLREVPQHLVVVGGGYIGLELGSVWRRLGSKVTVVEFANTIVPNMDQEVGHALFRELQNQGMEFLLAHKVAHVTSKTKGLDVRCEAADGSGVRDLSCDVLLMSIGRRPNTDHLALEAAGITTDDKGRIPVNNLFQTVAPHIFAIGDVIDGPMLAHKAEEEGVAVAEILSGQHGHVNYGAIPAVVYTSPEVASVGKTEEELKAMGVAYTVGKFPFTANSRARANRQTQGFVKILTHTPTDEILGVHIIAANAGDLIGEVTLAMEYRASAEDIARTCHAHPTMGEAVKEAALAAFSKALHA